MRAAEHLRDLHAARPAVPKSGRAAGHVLPAQGTAKGGEPVTAISGIDIIDDVDDYADAAIALGCGDDNPYQK